MSFKFNFFDDEGGHELQKDDLKEEIQWLTSDELTPSDEIIKGIDSIVTHAKMFTCGDVEIGYIDSKDALLRMNDDNLHNAIIIAEKQHSDLVAGKYEGGLKIWECTHDLLKYLIENGNDVDLKNSTVLDLGCGAGLLGIYTLINGAFATFQDYNMEVLEYVTVPNILLNIEEENRENEIKKCKFYSGDWNSFHERLPEPERFDVILTSETIYNQNNYDKIINIFLKRLKNDGVVYVAAKTYYFGVGGGTREFQSKIEKTGLLKSEVCWKHTDGVNREILKITFK